MKMTMKFVATAALFTMASAASADVFVNNNTKKAADVTSCSPSPDGTSITVVSGGQTLTFQNGPMPNGNGNYYSCYQMAPVGVVAMEGAAPNADMATGETEPAQVNHNTLRRQKIANQGG